MKVNFCKSEVIFLVRLGLTFVVINLSIKINPARNFSINQSAFIVYNSIIYHQISTLLNISNKDSKKKLD